MPIDDDRKPHPYCLKEWDPTESICQDCELVRYGPDGFEAGNCPFTDRAANKRRRRDESGWINWRGSDDQT